MKAFYDATVVLHAAAGMTALAALLVPLMSKKGGAAHRRFGWIFVGAMAVIGATGTVMAGLWLAAPLAIHPPSSSATPEQLAKAAAQIRSYGTFFAALAAMSIAAVWHGISGLRLKTQDAESWADWRDHAAWIATVVTAIPLLGVGLWQLNPLFIAFGAIALWGGIEDGRFVRQPSTARGAWLIRHLQSMLGGATAAVTAFTVFGLRRFIDASEGFNVYVWMAPVALGMAATIIWTRVYRRRFG